jgi:hypothetical protein
MADPTLNEFLEEVRRRAGQHVALTVKAVIERSIETERERCAKIADDRFRYWHGCLTEKAANWAAEAAAIAGEIRRASGQEERGK